MTLEEAKLNRHKYIVNKYSETVNGNNAYTTVSGKSSTMSGGMNTLFKLMVLDDYINDGNPMDTVTLNNSDFSQTQFTYSEFVEILKAVRDFGIQNNGKKTQLHDAINAATTIEEVEGIQW